MGFLYFTRLNEKTSSVRKTHHKTVSRYKKEGICHDPETPPSGIPYILISLQVSHFSSWSTLGLLTKCTILMLREHMLMNL